jgi:hypothetical protein
MVMPDRNSEGPRSRYGGLRLIIGGVIAAVLVVIIMAMLAGDPNPQQGESLPNAPSVNPEPQKQ